MSLPTGNDDFRPGGRSGVQAVQLVLHIHPVGLCVQVLSTENDDVAVLLRIDELLSMMAQCAAITCDAHVVPLA